MELNQLQRDVLAKEVGPVYLLQGEESYFVDQAVHTFEKNFLDESEVDFNLHTFYGRDSAMETIVSAARRFPMMSEHQLILVKEAQDLRDWKNADAVALLDHYLDNPVKSSVLVFAFSQKSMDKRLKVYKKIASVGKVFQSAKISEGKLPKWMRDYTSDKGRKMDPEASLLLTEYLGNSLQKVVNELDKLMLVVPETTMIKTEHIEKNIGISKDYNVWELQKALTNKDVARSNRIINYFEANPKSNPIQMVLPSLYAYFSKILVYHGLKDKSPNVAARAMGCPPFAVRDFSVAAANYKLSKVIRIIGYLRECDEKAKGVNNSSITHGFLMKELVYKVLH